MRSSEMIEVTCKIEWLQQNRKSLSPSIAVAHKKCSGGMKISEGKLCNDNSSD